MLQGINHLTLAVSDLAASVSFYHGLLGIELQAHWESGVYLSCGPLWLCLSFDAARRPVAAGNSDYTHYAFTIAEQDFTPFTERLRTAGVVIWKENRSEGDSFYFLDPDGHKLEIHVGSLAQRLAACRQSPYAGMVFKDE